MTLISRCALRSAVATSQRARLHPARLAAVSAAALCLGAHPVHAQGTVSGVIAISERPGVRTSDLNDAVVWLEPVDGAARSAAPVTVPIVMAERRYTPKVRLVSAGSTVEFPNQDPFRHNVFSKAGPAEFDLGLYDRGAVRRARFAAPGVYPIFCNIHARMVAFVVAVPTAWATQAEAGGRFSIPEVPAGRYRLRVWHNRGGEHGRELAVEANGLSNVAVALDARAYRFVQHKNKFGKTYPPDGADRY